MKRMLKKLTAIALAGVMVMALSVNALADDPEQEYLVGQTGATAANTASGSASGDVKNQGKIPDPVIKVKLPTSAAHVFDVYIDPHNLIQESSAAMFAEEATAFDTDTLVYFKNNGDSVHYSKTSDDIKIVNKSSVPVTVKMDAKWTKGNNATYFLAKDETDLASFKSDGEAALYLYMKDSEDNTAPVVEKDKGTPVLTYSAPKSSTAVDSNDTTSGAVPASYLPKYIKSVKFEWTAAADAQDMKLINEGTPDPDNPTDSSKDLRPANWSFTFTPTSKKTPSVNFDVSKLPKYTTLSGTTLNSNNAYKMTAAPAIAITETLNMDGNKTYTVDGGKAESVLKLQKGTTDIALITFEWDYEAIGANNYAITEKATNPNDAAHYTGYVMKLTGASGEGANITTDVNRMDGAYTLQKKSDGSGLEWKLGDGFTEDSSFYSLSFNLTGAITDGDVCAAAWDEAFPATAGASRLDVAWKVYACDGFKPLVTVTSPLTSATGTAELKVDFGCGDYKTTTITAASFKVNGTAQALSLDSIAIDGTTATITGTNQLFGGANGVLTLTFSNPSTGYSADVEVDLTKAAT